MNRKLSYKPSEVEKRLLDECKNDCFWYRSVPAAGLAGAAVLTCIKTGKIQSSKKYGSVPKVLAASGLFYALATASYFFSSVFHVSGCQQKFEKYIKENPDSDLSWKLKKLKKRGE